MNMPNRQLVHLLWEKWKSPPWGWKKRSVGLRATLGVNSQYHHRKGSSRKISKGFTLIIKKEVEIRKRTERFIYQVESVSRHHSMVHGHVFPQWHLQAASIICPGGLRGVTCFYQQCPQQANQSVCRWCLEFSKELMLLSWLKWGQVYFCTLLYFTITSCPITPNHVYHCKRDKAIQFRQKKLPCDPKQRQKWNKTQMLHLLRCLPKLYVNRGETRETLGY